MNKKEQNEVVNRLADIRGKKLNQVSRAGTMINLGFGDFVKSNTAYKTETGRYEIKEALMPKYAIHIDCDFRIACGDTILSSKSDIFQPNADMRNNVDFDEDNFEWDVNGANKFDEFIRMHFSENELEFYVDNIKVNKFGDLKITLSNDFCIDVFIDTSDTEECWRYFETGNMSSKHVVIRGTGFDEE